MNLKVFARAAAPAALITMFYALSATAADYPTKPIRMIVPVAPGGGMDTIARMVGLKLGAAVGQSVIIENRPGAGGNVGAKIAAEAPPDGYTLILVTGSHAVNPSLYRKLQYDPIKDFAPITQITSLAYLFVVHPLVPAKTVKEFIALAKSTKGGLTYGSAGTGLLGHLGMELLKTLGGFEAAHVPYRGGVPAMVDTIAGRVDASFPSTALGLPYVKSGKVRALAVTTIRRSSLLPDIPTVAESGFPGYEVTSWYGLLAPAGTPGEIIARLHDEMSRILKLPDIREHAAASGATPVGSTPAELAAYISSEMTKWAKVVKQTGARAD